MADLRTPTQGLPWPGEEDTASSEKASETLREEQLARDREDVDFAQVFAGDDQGRRVWEALRALVDNDLSVEHLPILDKIAVFREGQRDVVRVVKRKIRRGRALLSAAVIEGDEGGGGKQDAGQVE